MAEIPSLGEITNVPVDAERASGTPAVVYDNKETIRNLNQAAQFKAENDWHKYTTFLGNLKDVYKDIGDVSEMETATQDRDQLKKQMGELYSEIANNPRAALGGFGEIKGKIAKLKQDATESKLNRVYDMAHREYLTRNPELNTEDNKKIIQEYWNQPLGKRQSYVLGLPTQFDAAGLAKNILESPIVKQGFADTGTVGKDGKSPGDDFIFERKGTKYNKENFMKAWNTAIHTQQDKYGHSIRGAIEQRYNQLPKQLKDDYEKNGGIDKFFNDMGESMFGSDKDIVQVNEEKLHASPFEVQRQKAVDKLNEQKQKFGFDIGLEREKQKGRESNIKLKAELKGKSQNEKDNYLNNLVEGEIEDAKANGLRVTNVDEKGNKRFDGYEMQLSPATLKVFSYTEGTGQNKETIIPDRIVVSPDGGKVIAKFYLKSDGKTQYKDGKEQVDESKTKSFSTEEFKARVGKDLLGVSGLNKNLLPLLDDNEDGEDDNSSDDSANQDDSGTSAGSPAASTPTYKAKMADGSIVTSTDGKTWVNSKGKVIK